MSSGAISGRNTFACTYEGNTDCILSDDLLTVAEVWNTVDGNGFVADNTMNSGQLTKSRRITHALTLMLSFLYQSKISLLSLHCRQ